jgi:hypothetical protein
MFTWVLVLIVVYSPIEHDTGIVGSYSSMYECFEERELVMGERYPDAGTQAVCVKLNVKEM